MLSRRFMPPLNDSTRSSPRCRRADRHTGDCDLAAICGQQAAHQADGRRLAGAVRAEQAVGLPGCHAGSLNAAEDNPGEGLDRTAGCHVLLALGVLQAETRREGRGQGVSLVARRW